MRNLFAFVFAVLLFHTSNAAAASSISLDDAIEILKSDNLEIKGAAFDIDTALQDTKIASGNHYGKLDIIQDFARSNDAGNVFGFKLSSREANFGDFGAEEFVQNFNMMTGDGDYTTPPHELNYPSSRNYFQSKLKYEVPLFTGFKINSYEEIMNSVAKIRKLEKSKVVGEKIYELRKSFHDMALLEESISNLSIILQNIDTLEKMTNQMIDVGYAKKVDLLEVKAKKGNVERLLSQMDANKKLLYHYISFLLNQKVSSIKTPPLEVAMPTLSNDDILNTNLDIQMANNALDLKKSMVKLQESSYYPMVGAFGEVATADNTLLGDASDHSAYTVGARATWNIFNGGIDGANIEKARLEYLKTKTQVALANSGIELQIQKIKTEIQSYDKEIESLKNELALADEIYKNYEARYKEKLSSMSDVIIKQSEQIQKILQLQQTMNMRNERVFALEKLANGEDK
ncbi:MAG: hypothetical protein QG559_109 [Campylobacterota bacterium]|nr:hypothetical protein [Campylobacterota bacterium]